MVRLLLRAQAAPRAGELAKRPHLTTRAGRAQTSLPTTRVVMRAVAKIAASPSLLPATPTTTLRAAAGEAEALAAVLLVVLVALGVLAVGTVVCPGIKFGRP